MGDKLVHVLSQYLLRIAANNWIPDSTKAEPACDYECGMKTPITRC